MGPSDKPFDPFTIQDWIDCRSPRTGKLLFKYSERFRAIYVVNRKLETIVLLPTMTVYSRSWDGERSV